MARIRYIKPEFFTDDELGELPMAARLLFEALWCLADRAGRLEDRPLRIKVQALPYDDVDVDALLTQLHEHGFILRYAIDDQRLIEVKHFLKHQRPHPHEIPSTLPAPVTCRDIPAEHDNHVTASNDMPVSHENLGDPLVRQNSDSEGTGKGRGREQEGNGDRKTEGARISSIGRNPTRSARRGRGSPESDVGAIVRISDTQHTNRASP